MDKYETEEAIRNIQETLRRNGIDAYTYNGHDKRLDMLGGLLLSLISELGYEAIAGPSIRKIAKK